MNPTLKRGLQIGLVLLLLAGGFAFRKARSQANVGSGYVARQMCSCIFVAERSFESCAPDMLPIMSAIQSEVVEIEGQDGVRAWIPLLGERRAMHSPGFGCALQ